MQLVCVLQMLHYEDLKFLLRPPIYPSEYMEEYIRLLERFEVAMKLQDEQLIIPSHLQDCKPNFKIPQRGKWHTLHIVLDSTAPMC